MTQALVESFVTGLEFAVEGVLTRGDFSTVCDLRQTGSAGRSVFRRNDLRHAVTPARVRPGADHCSRFPGRPGTGSSPWAGSRRMPGQPGWRLRARGGGTSDRRTLCEVVETRTTRPSRDGGFARRSAAPTRAWRGRQRISARITRVGGDDDSDSRAWRLSRCAGHRRGPGGHRCR